jgi:molybdopterin-guanine dinucleotide biosynthesis protein A
LASVAGQLQEGQFSLQALAKVLKAKLIRPRHGFADQLRNVNTPAEWKQVQRYWMGLRRLQTRRAN